MTEIKPIVVYTADCIGNAANCQYPNEVKITDEVSAKQAFSTDMVCARYKNNYRSTANFEVANALPGDCDNDHSEIASEWITPEDIADLFADVPYVLHYSRHHMKSKGEKSARPRFHVVFLIGPERDAERYADLKQRLLAAFPFFDANAMDVARFLFGTENPKVIYHPGTISLNAFLDDRENEQAFADLGRNIPEGSRNSTMSQIGARIIKRYGDTPEAKNLFLQAAEQCTPPLDEQELERIWAGKQRLYAKIRKRGIQTNIGNLNREIRAANSLMKSIRQLIQNLKGWITELGEKRKELLAQKAAEEATLLPNLLMKYMEIRKEERKDWTRAGQNRGTSQDLKAVSEALSYLRQKGLSTVEDLEAFLESSGKSAADYRNQMKPKEARSKVIDGILASRTDCKECKPFYEKYQKIFFKKTKEKFKQEHSEVARYEKAAAYLAKHPDDKDSTQKELQQEQEKLLSEIAELKVPLTEVQEDLKKLRDIRYWVQKATPGTEESKEPPKKQPIKEVLQDKADEKKAQRTVPAQTKHKQQDMEL